LDSGHIRFKTTDVCDMSTGELSSNVSVVLQETELFNVGLRENITMMRDVDQATVEQAIQIACLQDIVARLSERP